MQKFFKVILPIKSDLEFSYIGDNTMQLGDIVLVPFGSKNSLALIWQEIPAPDIALDRVKHITKILCPRLYDKKYLQFLSYFKSYNITSLGQILKLILPQEKILNYVPKITIYKLGNNALRATLNRQKILELFNNSPESYLTQEKLLSELSIAKSYLTQQVKLGFLQQDMITKPAQIKEEFCYNAPKFSPAQEKVNSKLKNYLDHKKFNVAFLNGITGSGKTEIYFALIADLLNNSVKQILILLPEILLTKQFIDKFDKRFGFIPDIWHSQISDKKKQEIWYRIANNQIRILVGARSALFLPFKNLGLIILDEEHENSYKQEDNVIYHARDMAVARAYKEKFAILLVSATPSLETKLNIIQGKYKEFTIAERYGQATIPKINIIDMKREVLNKNQAISPSLKQKILDCLERKEQAMIFLNRRGYAPLKLCRSCGYQYKCHNCDSYMVEHQRLEKLICHHCEATAPIVKTCPECKSENSFISYGFGIERIKEELLTYFPAARIALLTSDETKDITKAKQIFQDIEAHNYDIILGTQIISKGHHFANLTLAGVIDGDIGSEVQDLRCVERMFQMLYQISGRVGRAAKKGQAFIQSYNPNTSFLHALQNDNIAEFYNYEITKREKFRLPPFTRFIAIIISDKNQNIAQNTAEEMANFFKKQKELVTYGAIAAPLFFLRGRYRYRILLKQEKHNNFMMLVKPYLHNIMTARSQIKIDVDPYNFI